MLRRLLVAALVLVAALTLGSVAFVWAASDEIMRWGGYSAAHERLVTGIVVTGTPARPVVYVTSSDPRFGPGILRREDPVDTNSGVLSRLERTRDGWRRVDLVRGLPRSNADHASNGMALSRDGTTLYIAQGSNTNLGAPAERFGNVPEYELSGAILAVDLLRIGDRTYDLPTRDDPDRSGVHDENDPFGGNRGKNQARLVPGGPVQVFASGLRNPYDVLVTSAGRLYTVQNGPNTAYGGLVAGEGPGGACTNEPREGGFRGPDTLHLVQKGGYYGYPNATRHECDYLEPGDRHSLAAFPSSTNGLAELGENELVTVSLGGELYRLTLSGDGRRVERREVLARLGSPLDVTTQGSDGAFPGTIWVAQYGEDQRRPIAVLEQPNARSRSWLTLPPSRVRRQEVSFVHEGGKFYLAGGDQSHELYDPTSRTWTELEPLPERLDHVHGVAVDGRIYYIGGLRDYPGPHSSAVYIYDPRTDRYSEGAAMPRGRGAGGVVADGGKIYYAGGLHNGRPVPWLDVYDPSDDAWTQLPDMPHARDHFQAVVVDGKLYAIGGREGTVGAELGATDAYEIATRSWQQNLAPLPTPRGGFGAAALGSDVYVIGGESAEGTHGTVEAYDTRTDTWRTLDPMPTARHGIQAAVCDGGLFVAAGGTVADAYDDPRTTFEAYVPRSGSSCADAEHGARNGFVVSDVEDASLVAATSLQLGPDGRLYASQQNGLITAFTVVRRRPGGYRVTGTEEIDLIQTIPNHDDDGSSATDFDAAVRVLWQKFGL